MSRRHSGGCVYAHAIVAVLLLVSDLVAQPPAAGLHDLVVYDPGTHERGLPGVRFTDNQAGGLAVEIPPTVHVHRYYYSGDKSIQGPIISGGPTIVVARHPKTGKKMYIDVVLPAGTPRIAYKRRSITYQFPDRRVELKFQGFPHNEDKVAIKFYNGKGAWRSVQEAHQTVKAHVGAKMKRSRLVQTVKDTAGGTGKAVAGAFESVTGLASGGLDKLNSLLKMVPGASYLRSTADDAGPRARQAEIRAAERVRRASETEFIPTNR